MYNCQKEYTDRSQFSLDLNSFHFLIEKIKTMPFQSRLGWRLYLNLNMTYIKNNNLRSIQNKSKILNYTFKFCNNLFLQFENAVIPFSSSLNTPASFKTFKNTSPISEYST